MGPVRQNPIQRTVRSVHVCTLHCAQLLCTILHRTDLIIFPLTLQTITIALTMSIWGKGILNACCLHQFILGRQANSCSPPFFEMVITVSSDVDHLQTDQIMSERWRLLYFLPVTSKGNVADYLHGMLYCSSHCCRYNATLPRPFSNFE